MMHLAIKYPSIFRSLVLVDFFVNIILWIIGGALEIEIKEIDQIIRFHFTQSIFDVLVFNAVKTIFLFILISELQNLSNESVLFKRLNENNQENHNTELNIDSDRVKLEVGFSGQPSYFKTLKVIEHLVILIICLASFILQVVKVSLIVQERNKKTSKMHDLYFANLIVSLSFTTVQFILSCLSFKMMKLYEASVFEKSKETQENAKKRINLSRLLSLSKPERWFLTVGFISLVFSSISNIVTPYYFGKIIDAAVNYPDLSKMNNYVVIMFLIYVAGSIASGIRSWLFEYSGQRVVARLRRDVFNAILKQDITFFDTNRTGELTSRISSDTQVLQNAVTVNISMLLRYLIQILGSIIFMFSLQPELTGILLAVIPVVSLLTVYYGRYLRKLRKEFQDNLAASNVTAEEAISSARTVRSFAAEDKITKVYEIEINKSFKVGTRLAASQGGFMFVVGLLTAGALSVVIWYGGKLVHNNKLTTGILASFLMYTLQVAMAFAFLMSLFGDFMQAVGASQRIFELLDTRPQIPLDQGFSPDNQDADESTFDGSLQIKNVSFSYPTRKDTLVLQDLSINIGKNQTVALVGPSGGGKSTIFSLIERYYDPNGGEISVGPNAIKLKDLNLNYFHRRIALVSQEPVLFGGSIKENILFGVPENENITMDQIIEVSKLANAHGFISDFEKGYDTLVGERGVRLSGGQKQRIAIARALLVKPKLLLLDEATSALDSESEHLVQEAMSIAMKDRTVCVIAHRLSTVRNANLVIVLDGGKIVESGTHDQLIEINGVYKQLVIRQMLSKKDEFLME